MKGVHIASILGINILEISVLGINIDRLHDIAHMWGMLCPLWVQSLICALL